MILRFAFFSSLNIDHDYLKETSPYDISLRCISPVEVTGTGWRKRGSVGGASRRPHSPLIPSLPVISNNRNEVKGMRYLLLFYEITNDYEF